MARRKEQASPTPNEDGSNGLPPRSLCLFVLDEWIDHTAKPPADAGPSWRWWDAKRRWRDAGEAWCEARGLSYCMTFLGWRSPSPSESVAGRVTGVTIPRFTIPAVHFSARSND